MAKYNPFFEKAGIGKSIRTAVGLGRMEFKPYLMASFQSNLKHLKTMNLEDLENTKEILSSAGHHKRLQSSSKPYVRAEEFERWI